MMQVALNAYGPRTTFVGVHPYAHLVSKPRVTAAKLEALIAEHPGSTVKQLHALIGCGDSSSILASLHSREKRGIVHSVHKTVPHVFGNGASRVLCWYPGAAA